MYTSPLKHGHFKILTFQHRDEVLWSKELKATVDPFSQIRMGYILRSTVEKIHAVTYNQLSITLKKIYRVHETKAVAVIIHLYYCS
jgi:hypothetical protein